MNQSRDRRTLHSVSAGRQVGYFNSPSVDNDAEWPLESIRLSRTFSDVTGEPRPHRRAALEYLKEGDTLHVPSMDHLADDLGDLRDVVAELVARGVTVQFHKENFTFPAQDAPTTSVLVNLLNAVAEFERRGDTLTPSAATAGNRPPPSTRSKNERTSDFRDGRETMFRFLRLRDVS
ncbi:recombinase family protein [Propionivibrio soli]|uniref:recombinase family protein n=1 Tax=Propionivibrio soli TaxID=2976531 RepID=UPI0021E929EC|nr:recombinase family protein [Propionivibrio soli]